jgi:hypothetical protein
MIHQTINYMIHDTSNSYINVSFHPNSYTLHPLHSRAKYHEAIDVRQQQYVYEVLEIIP